MSKGTPIYTLRIPAEILNAIDATVRRVNHKRRGEPYTRSSWILHAICEKLDHMERARKPHRRAARPTASEGPRNEVDLSGPETVGPAAGGETQGER